MKDILKMVRFDYLTARPVALAGFILAIVIFWIIACFFSPLAGGFTLMVAPIFVVNWAGPEDKNGFSKLYGILPVKRENITRARFLYILLVTLVSEFIACIIAFTAVHMELYQLLPQKSELMQIAKAGFDNSAIFPYAYAVGIFAIMCVMMVLAEMAGQIFGRENEIKVIIGVFMFLGLLAGLFFWLGSDDEVKAVTLPTELSAQIRLCIYVNLAVCLITAVIGEITARKVAKREL